MKVSLFFKLLGAAVGLAGIIGGSVYVYTVYAAASKAASSVASSGTLADILKPQALDGEETGQVNILVAGNSSDDPGHGGAELTDSLMVASITIKTNKITLISIPRDLWVTYNGASSKINAVYVEGGMTGLASVVEQVTGLAINHTVLINYAALKNMIDLVGGIDVTIDSPDARGIYDPMVGFSIGNGVQHLSGEQALLLARSRNDPTYDGRIAYGLPNGDFDRQDYQRKIVEALLAKISSASTLINPTTIAKLFADMSGNVTTNLTVGQLRRLYDLSKKATLVSVSIRSDGTTMLLADYRSYDGQSALIPSAGIGNYTVLQKYITTQLGDGEPTTET